MTMEQEDRPEAGGKGTAVAEGPEESIAVSGGRAADAGQTVRPGEREEPPDWVRDAGEGSDGGYEGGWDEDYWGGEEVGGPRSVGIVEDGAIFLVVDPVGRGAGKEESDLAEEGGADAATPPTGRDPDDPSSPRADAAEPSGESEAEGDSGDASAEHGEGGVDDAGAGDVAVAGVQGNEALGLRLAALEGQLAALFEALMEQSAVLDGMQGGAKKSEERKDELGPILKEKLAGLDEQIGVVMNLASEVLKGLEKAERGEDKKAVKELQSWITETLTGALNRLDERISGLVNSGNQQVKAFEGVRLDVDVVKKVGEAVGTLETRLLAYKKDLSRERELGGGAVRSVLLAAVAVAAPALLLAGAFVGQRWEVLPVEDATGGWRDHVWERYGGDVVGCVRRGLRDRSSFECVLDVRGSVDEVRARASGR